MAIELSELPGTLDNTFRYNVVSTIQDNVVTADGRRYAAWWNSDRHPIVAIETDSGWSLVDLHDLDGNPLESPVPDDGHNTINITVDHDGHIHVMANHHIDPPRYVRTVDPHGIDGNWTTENGPLVDQNLTYPKFIRTDNSLLLFYRRGSASSGDQWYETWDGTEWVDATKLLDGQTDTVNGYMHHITSRGDEIHVAVVWRGSGSSHDTNNDLCHMRSVDGGGTWESIDGTPVTLPVRQQDCPLVFDTADSGSGILGSAGLTVTSDGVPHIATHIYNDAATESRILYSTWTGQSWDNTKLFTDWNHKMPFDPVDQSISRPAIIEHDGRVVVVYRNNVDSPDTLRVREVTGSVDGDDASILNVNLYAYSPTYDTIELDGELSLLVTAARTNDVEHPDRDAEDWTSQPAAVLDVDLSNLDAVLAGTVTVPDTLVAAEEDDDDQEGVDPGLPAAAASEIQTAVTWLAADITSGRVITPMPDAEGRVSRAIGAYTSSSVSVPIPLSGPGSEYDVIAATQPLRSMVVLIVNNLPMWAGWVLERTRDTDATVDLACVSPEGYLRRRVVRDHTWTQRDEASVIASGLARDAEAIDGTGQGLGLIHDAPSTGQLRDRTYTLQDRKSVYDALRELSGVQGGPEWVIDPVWRDDDRTAVDLVFRVRDSLGVTTDATFDVSGAPVADTVGPAAARYSLSEDYTDGAGANWVVAYSSGEGDDQPESDPHVAQDQLDAGAPIVERHFQPSSSIRSKSVLDSHAADELDTLKAGTDTWTIEARWDAYPRLAHDVRLGDSVRWRLAGHGHPDGVKGQGRVVGWELDPQQGIWSPTLEQD